jgi:hypothetical protein
MFSPGTQVSLTNKIDHHDITEILFKVELNTIPLTPNPKIIKQKQKFVVCCSHFFHPFI